MYSNVYPILKQTDWRQTKAGTEVAMMETDLIDYADEPVNKTRLSWMQTVEMNPGSTCHPLMGIQAKNLPIQTRV
jgi:hypothetical protein